MARRNRLRRFAAVLAAAAVLLPLAALVRARFLPEVEVPVLRYARLAENATDADTVALADFFSQLEDLLEGGFESVTPRRLRQYAIWGRRLPLRPFLIAIDAPDPTLVTGGIPIPQDDFALTRIPGTAEDILRFFGYAGIVVGEPSADPAAGTITPAAAAAATKRGYLAFPPHGIGFSGEEGVAKIGPRTDFSALPRVRVPGGVHLFAARIAQDAVVPENFGTLRLEHAAGPEPLAVAVRVYLDDHSPPFARGESDSLAPGETLAIELGKDITFPVEVVVYDPLRMILLYRQKVQKTEVTRPAGWHLPLSGPEEGVPLDLDPPPDPEPEPAPSEDADFELDLGPEPDSDSGFSAEP